MPVNSVLYPTCAAISLIALLYRLPDLRRKREPSLTALCVFFGVSVATFLLSTPGIWSTIDTAIGVPNLSGMLAQCAAVGIAVSEQAVVLAWEYPWNRAKPQISIRVSLLLCVLITMAILYSKTVPAMVDSPTLFAVDSVHIPTYAAYLCVYLAAFIASSAEAARLSWRYSRIAERRWLRRGLRLAVLGPGLGFIYAICRLADVLASFARISGVPWEDAARLGAGIGDLALITGWTMPTWGPSVSRRWTWWVHYRAYRRLLPLWRAMYRTMPTIALDPPTTRNRQPLAYRLYRLQIEIQDARLALNQYVKPGWATAAQELAETRGLIGPQLDATVEATLIALALRAQGSNDVSRTDDFDTPRHDHRADPEPTQSNDLELERAWLVKVANAFAHSRGVRAAVGTVLQTSAMSDSTVTPTQPE